MASRLTSPSHYLKQGWLLDNWIFRNKSKWNTNQDTSLTFKKMHLKMSSVKWWPFCFGLDLLSIHRIELHWSKLRNASIHIAAYMRQWIGSVLVKIMACRLFGASHYLNQCSIIINWILRHKLQWNFNQNTKFFFHKNTSKISSAKWRPFCPGWDD